MASIGSTRDELRTAQSGCSPQNVAAALSNLVWSAGNVPSPSVVEHVIAIWNRLGQAASVKAIFLLAHAHYGRDSPLGEL